MIDEDFETYFIEYSNNFIYIFLEKRLTNLESKNKRGDDTMIHDWCKGGDFFIVLLSKMYENLHI